MGDSFWGAVIAVGVIVGALASTGAAIALVVGSFNKARVEALRQDNQDLRARVEDTENELAAETLKREASDARVERVEQENVRLWEQLTQKADVATVLEELRSHNTKVEQWQAAWALHQETAETHQETVEGLILEMVHAVKSLGESA